MYFIKQTDLLHNLTLLFVDPLILEGQDHPEKKEKPIKTKDNQHGPMERRITITFRNQNQIKIIEMQ
jgi:hypothetical protein